MKVGWLALLLCASTLSIACGGGSDDSGGPTTGSEAGGQAGAGGNAGAPGGFPNDAAGSTSMSIDSGPAHDEGSVFAAMDASTPAADVINSPGDASPASDTTDFDVPIAEPTDASTGDEAFEAGASVLDAEAPTPEADTPDTSADAGAPPTICDANRYVMIQSGVRDLVTGLEWQRWSTGGSFTSATAEALCAASPGWRLPTRAELLSIRGPNGTGGACPVDECAFLGERCTIFAGGRGTGLADEGYWNFDMMTGSSLPGTSTSLAVRCVRSP